MDQPDRRSVSAALLLAFQLLVCVNARVFATCSGIFRDKRGHFHILGHWFKNGKGGHAYSKDGLHWTFAGDAYDGELEWDDGTFRSIISLH